MESQGEGAALQLRRKQAQNIFSCKHYPSPMSSALKAEGFLLKLLIAIYQALAHVGQRTCVRTIWDLGNKSLGRPT